MEILSSSSLHVVWSEPELDRLNGIIRHYLVNIRDLQDGDSSQILRTTDNELTVQMLTPYSDYECSVAAVTVEHGPYSDPVLVQTLQDGKFQYSLIQFVS